MIGAHVPDAASAVVAEGKVRDHLLAAEHPDNGGKAGFFARFGLNRLRWRELHTSLVTHLSDHLVIAATPAGGGTRASQPFGRLSRVVRPVSSPPFQASCRLGPNTRNIGRPARW